MAETDRLLKTLSGFLSNNREMMDAGPRVRMEAEILQGVVVGVHLGSLEVLIRGQASSVPNVRYLSTYRPGFGDSVWVVRFGSDMFVIGELQTVSFLGGVNGHGPWHEFGASGEPAFQNSWGNFGGSYDTAAYCIQTDGWVRLKGLVAGGSSISAVIATLPQEARPPFLWGATQISNGINCGINIAVNGNINNASGAGSTAYISLEGITFPTIDAWERERDSNWFPLMRSLNGWEADSTSINFYPFIYRRGDGWRYLKGNIDNGTATAATFVGASYLQPEDMPAYSEMLCCRESAVGLARVDVRALIGQLGRTVGGATNAIILVNGNYWSRVGESAFSVDPNYPHKSMQVWNDTTLINGWVSYGTIAGKEEWRLVQYMLDDFGFVHWRGLAYGASKTSDILFNVPAGFRPAAKKVFPAVKFDASGGIQGRVDFYANGDVEAVSAVANWHWITGCYEAAA